MSCEIVLVSFLKIYLLCDGHLSHKMPTDREHVPRPELLEERQSLREISEAPEQTSGASLYASC